jgi:hypothetical protein
MFDCTRPAYSHHNILSTCFTTLMYLVTGNLPITSFATSLAIMLPSRTTPSVLTAKSAFLNTFLPAYTNTALTNSGLSSSTNSHTKLNRPGFRPSCKNPKHGSNPRAATTLVILAAAIALDGEYEEAAYYDDRKRDRDSPAKTSAIRGESSASDLPPDPSSMGVDTLGNGQLTSSFSRYRRPQKHPVFHAFLFKSCAMTLREFANLVNLDENCPRWSANGAENRRGGQARSRLKPCLSK